MPNIVLISTDQWRGDCLSIDGHPHAKTPYLDELALQGTRMTRAYSPAPTCVPARMSMLTGLAPRTHRRVGYVDGVEFDVDTTVASEFSKAGFQTQAIGKMHVYPERCRAGFDNVILHDGYLHHARRGRRDVRFYDDYQAWLKLQPGNSAVDDEFENGVHCNAVVTHPWERPEYQHPTNWATTQAIEWLYRRDPTRPFFLYLSYHRPHAPYNPPRWAFEQYMGEDLVEDVEGNWEVKYLERYRNDRDPQAHVAKYPRSVRQRALAGYYGNMTHIDQQIKRFFEALADFGLSEDTIICFTADHGDMMGDHHMWRKGYPYEGSARVPLIFAGPGIQPAASSKLTDLTDLMPTLLDLAGVEIPDGLDGVSIADELRGGGKPREYLHGEHYIFGQSLQWIIEDRYKYVWWSADGAEQVFDLQEDPKELNDLNLGEAGPEVERVIERSHKRLARILDGRPEGFFKDGKPQMVKDAKPLL